MSGNVKPPSTTVVVSDPAAHEKLDRIEANTKAILEKQSQSGNQEEKRPSYFPRGYF